MDIVDADPTPVVSADPQNRWLLVVGVPSFPPLSELAEEELRLAGIRFKPQNNSRSDSSRFNSLRLVRVADGSEREIQGLPEEPRLSHVRWSPDGNHISFAHTTEDGVELWVADLDSARARRLIGSRLSLVGNVHPKWTSKGDSILCALVPDDRGDRPKEPAVPAAPLVQENLGRTSPTRTYQDLLKNPHDENLLEHHLTVQLVSISLAGEIKHLGKPDMVWGCDPSPDGKFILVVTLHRPFSYTVPCSRFPRRVEIWDGDGNIVKEVVDRPLQEEIPISFASVVDGPRNFVWRSDAPATLCWAEAGDGGDAGVEVEVRDRLMIQSAPFLDLPRCLASLGLRLGSVFWGNDDLAMVTAWWWANRKIELWRVRPGNPEQTTEDRDHHKELVFERSWEDRYSDPGNPDLARNQYGRLVVRTTGSGRYVFLVGEGASDEGDRPFLSRFDLETKEATELFRSEAPFYEAPVSLLDDEIRNVLIRRESVEDPPNYFVRDLKTGEERRLTSFPHPTAGLLGLSKEQIRYQRKDGVKLTGTLYLPPNYKKEDGPLPSLLWAYPQEFKSADAAGQVTDSPYRFDRAGWWTPIVWLARGYAVLDNPTMPIVGEGDREPNETFLEQLVASAEAAVEELIRRGVTEAGRVGIGGHSYGAFMTSNLLSHSELFAAGVARSGAYNRTLTPFGFQSEERSLWEAPDVYVAMSPFMHADKVKAPILLIHGEADANSGTFPLQTERYYQALKGQGATTRMVLLPHEGHSYRARESILHMLWETEEWIERYVRAAEPESSENPASSD